MNKDDINDKIKVNKTKLSIADSSEQKIKIQKELKILNYKIQIEDLKKKIELIKSSL